MELVISTFGIQICLWVLTLLVLSLFFTFSALQKKRIEVKVDQVLSEVRGLDLRVSVVEARMEERRAIQRLVPIPEQTTTTPPKRGRPRKTAQQK